METSNLRLGVPRSLTPLMSSCEILYLFLSAVGGSFSYDEAGQGMGILEEEKWLDPAHRLKASLLCEKGALESQMLRRLLQ